MRDEIQDRLLVLGLGNTLMGDEGFGSEVIRRLKGESLPDNVILFEGGVGGFNLLGQLEGVKKLIVVDTMMSPSPPGEIRMLTPGPELAEPGKDIISFHQVGVLDLLQMWSLTGQPPETVFLVTRPERLDWGPGLTPALDRAADRAVNIIKELCRNQSRRSVAYV